MKKFMILAMGLVFAGSMMVSGCAPKQEEAAQAPAMEEPMPAEEGTTPAAEQAMPAAGEAAPVAPAQ
jgi:hypothetical protein